MIALLQLLAASAALTVAAIIVARRLRQPGDPGLDHLLTVLVVVLAAVVAVSLAVGVPGWYRPVPLLLASVALALLAGLADRLAPGRGEAEPHARRDPRSLLRAAAGAPFAAAAVALAAAAVVHRALVAFLLPAAGFDALAYHLVFVGEWVQRGVIGVGPLQEVGCCAWYPKTAEVTYAWLAVFPQSDRLVGLAQVGFLVLGGLAMASIARSVGAADRHAAVAGSLFVLTPIALWQASTGSVDVALAAGVLVTAAFMLRIVTAPAPAAADVLRFALAAAVTVGIKTTALAYVAVAIAILGVHLALLRRRGAAPARRSVVQACAVILALGALGSGWYLRAWAETGNPFWPYRVDVLGQVVFAGPSDPEAANPTPPGVAGLPRPLQPVRSWLADLNPAVGVRPDHERLGGLGIAWVLVGVPCAVAALVLSLRRRQAAFALLAVAVVPIAVLATPDAWWSRFTIPIVAVGFAGFAYVATRLPRPAAHALTAAAVGLSIVGVAETRPLEPIDRALSTPGSPRERPPPFSRRGDYAALLHLPDHARVGVVARSPFIVYLALGESFRRTVVALPDRPATAEELRRLLDENALDWFITRDPLPDRLLEGTRLSILDESHNAVVYRREEPGG